MALPASPSFPFSLTECVTTVPKNEMCCGRNHARAHVPSAKLILMTNFIVIFVAIYESSTLSINPGMQRREDDSEFLFLVISERMGL